MNVAALWGRWSDRVSLIGSGAATFASEGRTTAIALGSASWLVPLNRLRFEAGGTGTLFGTSGERAATSWLGFGRGHFVGRTGGLWLGVSGGDSRSEGETFNSTTTDIGAWLRYGEHRATATVSRVRTAAAVTLYYDDGSIERIRTPLGYTDGSAALHGVWGAVEVDASAMFRHGWKGSIATATVGSLAAAWWVLPNVAVTGAIGRQLADPLRGTAQARYATLALRFSAERRRPMRHRGGAAPVAVGEVHVEAAPAENGVAVVRIRAPGARTVEMMSDLTGWRPVDLARRGDVWEARLSANPGSHHVLVRMDGGAWTPPNNLPRIDDDFGGRVGLLVVP